MVSGAMLPISTSNCFLSGSHLLHWKNTFLMSSFDHLTYQISSLPHLAETSVKSPVPSKKMVETIIHLTMLPLRLTCCIANQFTVHLSPNVPATDALLCFWHTSPPSPYSHSCFSHVDRFPLFWQAVDGYRSRDYQYRRLRDSSVETRDPEISSSLFCRR